MAAAVASLERQQTLAGTVSEDELILATRQLLSARLSLTGARVDAKQAESGLLYAQGTIAGALASQTASSQLDRNRIGDAVRCRASSTSSSNIPVPENSHRKNHENRTCRPRHLAARQAASAAPDRADRHAGGLVRRRPAGRHARQSGRTRRHLGRRAAGRLRRAVRPWLPVRGPGPAGSVDRRPTGRCGRPVMSGSSSATACSTACCLAWKPAAAPLQWSVRPSGRLLAAPPVGTAGLGRGAGGGGHRDERPGGGGKLLFAARRRPGCPSSGGPRPAAARGRSSATASAGT